MLRQWRAMWKYCQEHPEGSFIYGPWDSFPIWPDARATHARWLKQYLPMLEEGTRVYLEVSDSDLFRSKPPSDVVVSVFANVETYLVLANYGSREVVIDTVHRYVPTAEPSAPARTSWKLKGRSLVMLRQFM